MHISINIRKRSSDLDEHMRGIMGGALLAVFAQIIIGAVSFVGSGGGRGKVSCRALD